MADPYSAQGRIQIASDMAKLIWDTPDGKVEDIAGVLAYYYENILDGIHPELAQMSAENFFQLILEERAKPKEKAKKKVKA